MTGGLREPTAEDHGRLVRDHDAVAEQLVAADAVLVALGRSSSDADAGRRDDDGGGERAATVSMPGCVDLPAARRGVRACDDGWPAAGVPELCGAHPLRRIGKRWPDASPWTGGSSRSPTSSPTQATADETFKRSPVPDADRRTADPRRRGGGRDQPVADQGGALRRTRDGDAPTFAAQAAAVVRNLHLVRELEGASASWRARSSSCRR